MTWHEEIQRVAAIVGPGSLTTAQAEAIGSSWAFYEPKRILELGTGSRTETCFLAAMAASHGGHVTTMELPETDAHRQCGSLDEDQLRRCGTDNVTVVRRTDGVEGFFREHFATGGEAWDFVYLAGNRDWRSLTGHFAVALAALRIGGWLCVNNILNLAYPDVGLAWRQVIRPLCPNSYERDELGFASRHA